MEGEALNYKSLQEKIQDSSSYIFIMNIFSNENSIIKYVMSSSS